MRTTIVTISFAAVALGATVADAQRVEYVATVEGTSTPGIPGHRIGDTRYVALGTLDYEMTDASVQVLDIAKRAIIHPRVTRKALLDRFGHHDAMLQLDVPPDGELVMYTPQTFGLYLSDGG